MKHLKLFEEFNTISDEELTTLLSDFYGSDYTDASDEEREKMRSQYREVEDETNTQIAKFGSVEDWYASGDGRLLALGESAKTANQFWHGSTDMNFAGKKGIHIGTKLAATQALQARIGVPAEGEWDGTREYGKTLLAGKKRLAEREKELGYYVTTGFNVGADVPENDYYPGDRKERAKYSDGTPIPMDSKPVVFEVQIVGPMSNTINNPHEDFKANSYMNRALKMGNAKRGYYYENVGEDSGSISAVVPDGSFLKIVYK